MKGSKVFIAFVAALAAMAAFPVAAQATQPEPVVIEMNGVATGPNSVTGTWAASGAVADAGTYEETFRFRGNTAHVVKRLTGAEGTIVLKAKAVVVWISPTVATFAAGQWRFASGTGAYEDLHGQGSPAVGDGSSFDAATGVAIVTHEGVAHYD